LVLKEELDSPQGRWEGQEGLQGLIQGTDGPQELKEELDSPKGRWEEQEHPQTSQEGQDGPQKSQEGREGLR
jgi:hypothetical protein